ncbi:flagellar filament capping protein FliD [Erwinia persicina]|uniref:Flagellar hook-associated protein 2 n=1 Tax=Erwinia persicina TaxID=55211 RepID=A0A354AF84_9GAMM|nr:flagellar filament capping protein FliD [Erwinia persicina]AXU94835.1 flagellar filament capping protein FliD [Erwinia persicina]MBC3947214.1 flagellar filament capping protein FliD [Erwinia persicina]MBD8107982.1 flagellar filament capping protein FliD [Erwinia persicina]MBD8167110.1 flagellar filament capping protein FliD [Erwinia persicina]MBD8211062.1 flagellar filament capping protein FliD [Erwinia persicina]
MASISTLGIGSGLELSTILAQTESAEKAALTPISKQQTAYTAKLSAYSTMKSALTTFQAANTKLNSANLFSSTKTSSTSTAFSATTTTGAVAGKYTIAVSQLASSQTLTSGVQTSNSTALATSDSTISIKLAGSDKAVDVKVTAANSSMTGIRDAINAADTGMTASIIKTGDGSYRLSLTSDKTGTDNAATISVTGDSTLQGMLNYDGTNSSNMTQSVAAQNAMLKVNNVDIESSSNTISDALEGITLNLTAETTGTQSLTITKDTSSASNIIAAWATAYNTLQDSLSALTKYTAVDAGTTAQDTSNGALLGDSTLRTIQSQMKDMLTNTASTSTYKTLSQIGITTDPTNGKLITDQTKLDAALAKDSEGIKAMFMGDGKTTGITTKLDSNLTSWLSTKGVIQAATDGVSKTLNNLTAQYNKISDRIDDTIARLKTQFTALDVMISKLNNTSSYLTQQFATTNSTTK